MYIFCQKELNAFWRKGINEMNIIFIIINDGEYKVNHVGIEINEESCTGCGACKVVCPQSCIDLRLDRDGYWKRHVINEKCVNCQKCLAVCSAKCDLHVLRVNHSYVAYAHKKSIAYKSASGGVAYILSEIGIEKGYTVIGAAWDLQEKGVKHICINNKRDLDKLRKSKYVQSYISDAFQAISENEKVIIIGTPCQIQGAYNIFGNRDNMLYIEMDCMGPSGKNLLDKYIQYLNTLNSSGIRKISMREKTKDWINYGVRVEFKDGTEYYSDKYKDPFCLCFNFAHTIQDTCLKHCRWIQQSSADIRIGDAWNYAAKFPYRIAKNGLSLVSVQTLKGNEWFDELRQYMDVVPVVRGKPQKKIIHSNEKIFECLRDENKTIIDAVNIFQKKPLLSKIIEKIEEYLSRNYYIYLGTKKIKEFCTRRQRR